jgi:hypothetical protein
MHPKRVTIPRGIAAASAEALDFLVKSPSTTPRYHGSLATTRIDLHDMIWELLPTPRSLAFHTANEISHHHRNFVGLRADLVNHLPGPPPGHLRSLSSRTWSFLQQALLMKGFDRKWCKWINDFVTNGNVGIRVNDAIWYYFQTQKGLQKDILFPRYCLI